MSNPQISVILTTFNEDFFFFEKCVDSILKQTFEDFELIIIFEPNDLNIDNLSNNFHDSRIIAIINETKLGFVKSLNKGTRMAKGHLIARIDSDDICRSDRFQIQYDFLNSNEKIDVIGSSIELIDKNGHVYKTKRFYSSHKNIRRHFFLFNGLLHSSVMLRKKILIKYGLYNEKFEYCEDLELWLRLMSNGCIFANMKEYLVQHRAGLEQRIRRNKSHFDYLVKARRLHMYKIFPRYIVWISFIISKVYSKIKSAG